MIRNRAQTMHSRHEIVQGALETRPVYDIWPGAVALAERDTDTSLLNRSRRCDSKEAKSRNNKGDGQHHERKSRARDSR